MKHLINKNPLPVVILTVFIDMLGFGILIPIIPLLLANPNSPYYLLPKSYSISQGYILLGFLTAAFPLAQFISTPILGQLSDKYGRKSILALSLAGTSISYILFVIGILIGNIPLLFLARILDGITGGNISVAQAAVADVTTPQNRAKNFGLIGMAFGLGFIFGPYLGGKLSDPAFVSWFNAATPFWFAAILSFLNVISVLFLFPETLSVKRYEKVIDWTKSVHNIIKAYSMKEVRTLFITSFLFQGGFSFFITFFNVYLINKFHFTQGNTGDFFSYLGIWVAITQGVVTRLLSKKFKEYHVLRVSLITTGFLVLVYFLPNVWWQLLFIVPFFAIFNGLSQANLPALVSGSVGPEIQGEVLGINSSVQALAQAIPPILSGYIAATLTPETPLLVASVVIIASGWFFILFYRPLKTQSAHEPVISH